MNERKAAFTRSKRDCFKPFEMKKYFKKKMKKTEKKTGSVVMKVKKQSQIL